MKMKIFSEYNRGSRTCYVMVVQIRKRTYLKFSSIDNLVFLLSIISLTIRLTNPACFSMHQYQRYCFSFPGVHCVYAMNEFFSLLWLSKWIQEAGLFSQVKICLVHHMNLNTFCQSVMFHLTPTIGSQRSTTSSGLSNHRSHGHSSPRFHNPWLALFDPTRITQ